jgi:ribosome-binding factor A
MGRDEEHAGHRHARLTQLIHEELEALLRDEVADPRLEGARVSAVELSVDYRSARVRFVLGDWSPTAAALAQAERGLERASAFLRARLGEALDLKRVPELRFIYDRDAAAQARAGALLDPPKK